MTIRLDSSRDCARAWEAMPWVLQGQAPQNQSEWLTQHLETCIDCRAEFEQQSRLRLAMSLPHDIPLDPAEGLARLMARVESHEREQTMRAVGNGRSRILRGLVAVLLIQSIGLGVLSLKLWTEPPVALYRTRSQSQEPMAREAEAMHVVPDATMTLAEWDAMLQTMHLQVVEGPNEVGAYTVVLQDSSVPASKILDQLRGTHRVRLVEPVVHAP